MAGPSGISIRNTTADAVLGLRHAVLRVGLPLETARINGDEAPTSHHLGAFDQSGLLVGCATITQQPWDGWASWQIRVKAILRRQPKPPMPGEPGWRLGGVAVAD